MRFNPRTHTGCDKVIIRQFKVIGRFNPRTHTGCDLSGRTRAKQNRSFNPRTHTGCDGLACANSNNAWTFQSTHPHGVRPATNS